MSLGMMVTRLAWIAQRLVSSKRPTRYASQASWSARTARDWKRRSAARRVHGQEVQVFEHRAGARHKKGKVWRGRGRGLQTHLS